MYFIDTAVLHYQMRPHGNWQCGSEVQLRVAKFAVTREDPNDSKFKIALLAHTEAGSPSDLRSLGFDFVGAAQRCHRVRPKEDFPQLLVGKPSGYGVYD